MTETELSSYLKNQYPKEDESVDWKNWSRLTQNISGREGEDAISYISAISNMSGGFLIIGVDDDRNIEGITDVSNYTIENIKLRILGNCPNLISEGFYTQEFITDDSSKRVWVISIPRHAPRRPVYAHAKAWQRVGDSLTSLRPERMEAILRESLQGSDYSSEICPKAEIEDLDPLAIEVLRKGWSTKARREDFLLFGDEKILQSLNLLSDEGLTNAAVILLGKETSIGKLLPGSEVILEWRQDENRVEYDYRKSWKNAFLLIHNEIWEAIDARNIRVPFQEGFIQKEIYAFHEKSIREAILNAVAHRDYSFSDRSVFISASPAKFSIENPGGLLVGVTIKNILSSKAWRNRLLMETLEKISLVERSGQGIDDIFKFTLSDGKGMPDLSKVDESKFQLVIPALVRDVGFVRYVERVANQRQIVFTAEDLIDLERIKNGLSPLQENRIGEWIKIGIVERVGITRGSKIVLSRDYYQQEQRLGEHTRLSGLSREATKALILQHILKNGKGYMYEFRDAFPNYTRKNIGNMLQELRLANKIQYEGSNKKGYWTISS
ncbi:MAG: RNA-binding domain-containing protein [Patescibacteria group bacterium]